VSECVEQGRITPEELSRFAMDPGAVADHEVKYMRTLATTARQRLLRYDCLRTETIVSLAAGACSPAERANAEAHLRICARCTEEFQFAQSAEAMPDPLLGWTAPTMVERLATHVRRLIARLVSDIPTVATPALALRGVPVGERPQIFEAEDITVSVTAERTRKGMLVTGIISAQPDLTLEGVLVRLVVPGAEAVVTEEVEQGAFQVGPVPVGVYDLEITLPDRVIVIEGLQLRA
jgi:hypothetical protein